MHGVRNIICCTSTEDRNERKLNKQLSKLKAEVTAYQSIERYLKDTAKTLEEKIKDGVSSGRHSPTLELAYQELIQTKVKIARGEKSMSDLSNLKRILGTDFQD